MEGKRLSPARIFRSAFLTMITNGDESRALKVVNQIDQKAQAQAKK